MRSEEEYVEAILDLLHGRTEAPPDVFPLLEEALRDHPASSELWCLRGDVIYCSPADGPHPLEEMLASYERAVEINPCCAEAWESIGRYHDVFTEDLAKAEDAFRKALMLGAGWISVHGLGRVLAQLGRRDEALSLLGDPVDGEEPDLRELREEVLSGTWEPCSEAI